MSLYDRRKILTIEPGMSPAALAAILFAVEEAVAEHSSNSSPRPRVKGLAGGQLAIDAVGMRP